MTRTIKQTANRFAVIYRGAVECHFATEAEATAYIRAGKFPTIWTKRENLFKRHGPSPFRRT
jgi:hypothetical protein